MKYVYKSMEYHLEKKELPLCLWRSVLKVCFQVFIKGGSLIM